MQACAEEARGQLPTSMAKGVIVGLVAINVQQPLMEGTVH
jgi:hypothetical protein